MSQSPVQSVQTPMGVFHAIPKIMQDMEVIKKTKTNSSTGYKYRGIDDVLNAINEPFSKHGVFVAPKVLDVKREERQSTKGGNLIYSVATINFKFIHQDGSWFDVVTVGEAMDSGDKSMNKAMSVAMKYAMFMVLAIPTDEQHPDTEHETPEVDSKETPQPKQPVQQKSYSQSNGFKDYKATQNQVKMIFAKLKSELSLEVPQQKEFIMSVCKKESSNDWMKSDIDNMLKAIEAKKSEQQTEFDDIEF
jgi:Holliday junction resolvase RusA-like endonuclease